MRYSGGFVNPHITLVSPGGVIRYIPTSTLRAVTLTVTDHLTGAVSTFHGRHDGDTPLYEWNTGGATEAVAALTAAANGAEHVRKLHTPDHLGDCAHCLAKADNAVRWPCPTIRALDGTP